MNAHFVTVPYGDSSDSEDVPRAPSVVADSSDEEMTIRQLVERQRHSREGAATVEVEDDEADEDDPPPNPPAGFELVDWVQREPLEHFLLYCTVGRSKVAGWHVGAVVKAHAKNRYGYTHDAYLDGSSEKRGVRLTEELYDTGYWYKMSPVSA